MTDSTSNVKRLIAHRISADAIPRDGGIADGIRFLSDPQRVRSTAKAAEEWVKQVIIAVRQAGDPNPWKNADDEEIAGEILKRIDAREGVRQRRK